MSYPIGSMPSGGAKDAIIDAKNALAAYNEMVLPGCEGFIVPMFDRVSGAPTENATWGTIKDLYR